jgi:hypothetical protein
MRFLLSFVAVALLTGCVQHRASIVPTYFTKATLIRKQKDSPEGLLLVRIARLNEQDGKVTDKIVSLPVLELEPGVPVTPIQPGWSAMSGSKSGGMHGAEEHVEVEVAWEGEHNDEPVCTVTVRLEERIVSKTKLALKVKDLTEIESADWKAP